MTCSECSSAFSQSDSSFTFGCDQKHKYHLPCYRKACSEDAESMTCPVDRTHECMLFIFYHKGIIEVPFNKHRSIHIDCENMMSKRIITFITNKGAYEAKVVMGEGKLQDVILKGDHVLNDLDLRRYVTQTGNSTPALGYDDDGRVCSHFHLKTL